MTIQKKSWRSIIFSLHILFYLISSPSMFFALVILMCVEQNSSYIDKQQIQNFQTWPNRIHSRGKKRKSNMISKTLCCRENNSGQVTCTRLLKVYLLTWVLVVSKINLSWLKLFFKGARLGTGIWTKFDYPTMISKTNLFDWQVFTVLLTTNVKHILSFTLRLKNTQMKM